METATTALCAAGCLLHYAQETQRTALLHINSIHLSQNSETVLLDAATRRNLELTQNLVGGTENTLASVLDKCVTPMGSRLLKRWIHQPIRDVKKLKERQDIIESLQKSEQIAPLQLALQNVGDMERILARVALRSARPRDFTRLRSALEQIPEIEQRSQQLAPSLDILLAQLANFDELADLLKRSIIDNPPQLIRDGGVIAEGYNAELDESASVRRRGLIRLKSALTPCTVITFKSAKGKHIKPRFTMFAVKPSKMRSVISFLS